MVQAHGAAARVPPRRHALGEAAHHRRQVAAGVADDGVEQPAVVALDDGDDERVAALEVHVEGAARVAGAGADVVEAGRVEPLLAEQRGSGVDERFARLGLRFGA